MGWMSQSPRKMWSVQITSDDGHVLLAAPAPPVAPAGALLATSWAEFDRIRIQPLDDVDAAIGVSFWHRRGGSDVLIHEEVVPAGASRSRAVGLGYDAGGPVDPSSDVMLGPWALHGSDKLYVSTTASVELVIIAHGRDVFECVTDDPAPSVTVINNEPSPGA